MTTIELQNISEVIIDSKNELQTRLDSENNKLIDLKEQIRDFREHGQTSPFNLYNTLKDVEIDLCVFINRAENNITLYENEQRVNVITNTAKDQNPFILKCHILINDGEPVEINRYFKDNDQLTKSIGKLVNKSDETLEVLFSGEVFKYTLVFNKVKLSDYGTGCHNQQKKIEYKSDLVNIPKANKCFRKCVEIIYNKDFSREYREFIEQTDRC